jgi:hypothetical protein
MTHRKHSTPTVLCLAFTVFWFVQPLQSLAEQGLDSGRPRQTLAAAHHLAACVRSTKPVTANFAWFSALIVEDCHREFVNQGRTDPDTALLAHYFGGQRPAKSNPRRLALPSPKSTEQALAQNIVRTQNDRCAAFAEAEVTTLAVKERWHIARTTGDPRSVALAADLDHRQTTVTVKGLSRAGREIGFVNDLSLDQVKIYLRAMETGDPSAVAFLGVVLSEQYPNTFYVFGPQQEQLVQPQFARDFWLAIGCSYSDRACEPYRWSCARENTCIDTARATYEAHLKGRVSNEQWQQYERLKPLIHSAITQRRLESFIVQIRGRSKQALVSPALLRPRVFLGF